MSYVTRVKYSIRRARYWVRYEIIGHDAILYRIRHRKEMYRD